MGIPFPLFPYHSLPSLRTAIPSHFALQRKEKKTTYCMIIIVIILFTEHEKKVLSASLGILLYDFTAVHLHCCVWSWLTDFSSLLFGSDLPPSYSSFRHREKSRAGGVESQTRKATRFVSLFKKKKSHFYRHVDASEAGGSKSRPSCTRTLSCSRSSTSCARQGSKGRSVVAALSSNPTCKTNAEK